MTAQWTNRAQEQLLAIYDFIKMDSEVYAERVINRLIRCSEQISLFPQSGRMVPEFKRPDIREVIDRPYRIIYLIKEDQIDILAVIHNAMLLHSEFER